MNHLTNLYKHKCEQLQEQINNMKRMLNEVEQPPPHIPPQVHHFGPTDSPDNIIQPGKDGILPNPLEKPRPPGNPDYTEQELFDIIEWMLQQLNRGCDPGNPCVTAEEIAAIREALRRIAREIANGVHGWDPNGGLRRLYKEWELLLKRTRVWNDRYHRFPEYPGDGVDPRDIEDNQDYNPYPRTPNRRPRLPDIPYNDPYYIKPPRFGPGYGGW